MKIIFQDTKQGVIEIVPETLDDLWHISHIIEEKDVLFSKTSRRIQDTTGDKLRRDRGVKKTFFLSIKVKSINFHIFTGKLRAKGSIVSGPEDFVPLGSHHTLEIKLNTPLKIKKENWSKYALNRIRQAVTASKKLLSIIVAIEDDVAELGLIHQFGIKYHGPIIGNIPGKRIIDRNRQKKLDEFYQQIAEVLLKFKNLQNIVIIGPGFTKNNFNDFLENKYPNLSKISITESTGTGGRVGIQEILKKGVVEKLNSENRIAKEISAIDNALREIAKGSNMVAYGKKEVINAANTGAIKKLLVLDKSIRTNHLEKVMDFVENMRGHVMVISSEHDGGKQLDSLGGLVALLRYPIK
jgi:protein pelota